MKEVGRYFHYVERVWRSFGTKLVLLLLIFVAVPVILYSEFRTADEDKQRLLLKGTQEQGRLIALSVEPVLKGFDPHTVQRLDEALARISSAETKIKVLFRPRNAADPERFYYVASAPKVSAAYLEAERAELVGSGIFKNVPETCSAFRPSAARYTNPKGEEELLVSLNAINTEAGCWVIITSSAAAEILGTGIGRPYKETPAVRLAVTIYLLMAVFIFWLFLDGIRSLRRFTDLARRIRTRGGDVATFAALNHVPELDGVAREFDRMVGSLRQSAHLIRYMAEDNAHAFKTPIAVISQSIEPLKRSVTSGDARLGRAVEMIEHSVNRLDKLVSAAKRMDEAVAESIDPALEPVDLTHLLRRIADGYSESLKERNIKVSVEAGGKIVVLAQEDALETVVENLVENAASFSPPGKDIRLSAHARDGTAFVTVDDSGPGVEENDLERIFERYYSRRGMNGAAGDEHFGVGLWIVRRNVEALGGTVEASNRSEGGLHIRITLPLT